MDAFFFMHIAFKLFNKFWGSFNARACSFSHTEEEEGGRNMFYTVACGWTFECEIAS